MHNISFNISEELAKSLGLGQADLEGEVRLMAALRYFELGRLSSGAAAELAGISRQQFLNICCRQQYSQQTPNTTAIENELREELQLLRRISA
jgi:predicted HTH domain antitoxin